MRWPMVRNKRALLLPLFFFIFSATPAAAENSYQASGRWLQLDTAYSTHFTAYETGPADAAAAVLVIPDIWGINKAVIDWADRLGELALHVVVIDYYDGRMVTSTAMAHEVFSSIDPVWIKASINGGLNYLRRQSQSLAILGWGQGAVEATVAGQRAGGGSGIRAMLAYNDSLSAQRIAAQGRSQLPLLEVTTRFSLVDPGHPPAVSDLESTWQASRRFLLQRLSLN